MRRDQLEHVIRACADLADDPDIVVVGSQAILGEHPDAPASMLTSIEADVYPFHHPERADVIDGAIGEGSPFQATFGYYAHGVGPETARAPTGWQERLAPIRNENTRGATGWCLEAHDLVLSKCAVAREKDVAFVDEALRHRLVAADELRARMSTMPLEEAGRTALGRLLEGRIARALGQAS